MMIIGTTLIENFPRRTHLKKLPPEKFPAMISVNTNPGLPRAIWTPDLVTYNTAEAPMSELIWSVANVYSDGTVIWSRPGLVSAQCNFDLTDFPRDEQNCEWKIGSWAYGDDQLKLVPLDDAAKKYQLDWSNFMANEEWDLGTSPDGTGTGSGHLEISSKHYGCCPQAFEAFHMRFSAKRRSQFYTRTFELPALILAGVILLSFCIPFTLGERISFATTMALALVS
jgi:nicotinic acetylcholine receptor, invertebrate